MHRHRTCIAIAAALAATVAGAQQPDPRTQFTITGHVVEPQAVPPTDARIASLRLPSGFRIHRFAEGLHNPRMIAVAGDGTVYVTQRIPGNLVMLRDVDRDGIADAQMVVLRIPGLHGIAIQGSTLYLVDVNRIYAAEILPSGLPSAPRVVSRGIPEAGQHPNRTLGIAPDGTLFVSIGSTCNACDETDPEYATLSTVDRATGERRIFASGLRNTIGFDWHPASGDLWGFDHGIDWLGDDEQSEELNLVRQGSRYGWPYVYDHDQLNPQDEPVRVTQLRWAELSEEPVGSYTAHAAPMQMTFHEHAAFPAEYRDDAFVAMHGSWNRKPPSGYEVLRLRFGPGGAFEGFEPFVSGFLVPQPDRQPPLPGAQPYPPQGYIGRPTGIATAADGALLVGDDSNNVLYRVVHGGKLPALTPQKLAIDIVRAGTRKQMSVSSPAFAGGGRIPVKYSDYGAGISPPLSWSGAPEGTQSIVVMAEDPEAVSPLPFVHWIALLPGNATSLAEGVPPAESIPGMPRARQGSNSRSEFGYFGPRPPAGDPPHDYHFQVFALDTQLELPSGFNRHALLKAMEGHVLAAGQVVGKFARAP